MQPAFTKKTTNFYQVRRRFINRDKFDANVKIGLILVGYCSLLCRIRDIPVRKCTVEMVPVFAIRSVAWFGLCFSKSFAPGNILGWTNLLEYHSLAVPD